MSLSRTDYRMGCETGTPTLYGSIEDQDHLCAKLLIFSHVKLCKSIGKIVTFSHTLALGGPVLKFKHLGISLELGSFLWREGPSTWDPRSTLYGRRIELTLPTPMPGKRDFKPPS